MAVNLKGRSLLTLEDITPSDIRFLLDLGCALKSKRRAGTGGQVLKGKHIALLCEKTSVQMRCAFEAAAVQEGAHASCLDADSFRTDGKESLEDSARVLGRFFDGIGYCGCDQSAMETLADCAGVPVWSGLADAGCPVQILAAMMTLEEHCGKPLHKIKAVFPGDIRSNLCYAWMTGAAMMGMHFVALGPQALAEQLDGKRLKRIFAGARRNGGLIEITDGVSSLKGADVIYGGVWASAGEEAQLPARAELLAPFRVTEDTLKAAENPDVLYMHGLPAFHDFETKTAREWQEEGVDIRETAGEVFRSRHSVVFDEAENQMHAVKAILTASIG